MAVKLFGGIVIGSMETEMKIFELSARKGMREIDCVSARIHLGGGCLQQGTAGCGESGGTVHGSQGI